MPAKISGSPAMAVRFRLWRESTLPRAAYRVEPRFWTPAGRQRVEAWPDWQRRALKTFEPRVTGLAWTARRLYLVVATATGGYEHVAQLIHACALVRGDPDYIEHRGKRVSLLLLCDDCPSAVADFARRHRVRVVAQGGESTTETVTRTVTSFCAPPAVNPANLSKSFSP